ncbi:hypothetical protein N0V90_000391 [Kalmusia sp. IMI 367209]|nr:hypothetical protein N0V90_000391 [Kalmusia sp. IMI 367209]
MFGLPERHGFTQYPVPFYERQYKRQMRCWHPDKAAEAARYMNVSVERAATELASIRELYEEGRLLAVAGPSFTRVVGYVNAKNGSKRITQVYNLPIERSKLSRRIARKAIWMQKYKPLLTYISSDCICNLLEAVRIFIMAVISIDEDDQVARVPYQARCRTFPPQTMPPIVDFAPRDCPEYPPEIKICPPCTIRDAWSDKMFYLGHLPPPQHKFWSSADLEYSWSPFDIFARHFNGLRRYWNFSLEDKEEWLRDGWFYWNDVSNDEDVKAMSKEDQELWKERYSPPTPHVEIIWHTEPLSWQQSGLWRQILRFNELARWFKRI